MMHHYPAASRQHFLGEMKVSPKLLFQLAKPKSFQAARPSCQIGKIGGCYGDRRFVIKEGFEAGHIRFNNNLAHGPEGMWFLMVAFTGFGWIAGIISNKPHSLELKGCAVGPSIEFWDYPGGHFIEMEME